MDKSSVVCCKIFLKRNVEIKIFINASIFFQRICNIHEFMKCY